MATYVYETIPTRSGDAPKRFEVRQSMKDAAFTHHPETGERVRRVITGGYGLMGMGDRAAAAPEAPGHCCGAACACHGGPRLPACECQ